MKSFPRPSPALIISLIALFVALGGTTYAATSLPKNSVGTPQLKNNSVTPTKIRNGAVTATKIDTKGITVPYALRAGNAVNAVNAVNARNMTNALSLEGHPASFFAPVALQPGQSESGDWALGGGNYIIGTINPVSGYAMQGFAFPLPLGVQLDTFHVQWLWGTQSNAACPGAGHAAPGYLCVYTTSMGGMAPDNNHPVSSANGIGGADPFGFILAFDINSPSAFGYGSWTVTAP